MELNSNYVLSLGFSALLNSDEEKFQHARNLMNAQFIDTVDHAALEIIAAVITKDAELFDKIIGNVSKLWGNPNPLTQMVLRLILDKGFYQTLIEFWMVYPEDRAVRPIVTYFAGCAKLMTGTWNEATELFSLFASELKGRLTQDYVTDRSLNVIFRQGRLVAGTNKTETIIQSQSDEAERIRKELRFEDHLIDRTHGLVFMAVADTNYIEKMAKPCAEGILSTLNEYNACAHFVVMGRTPEALKELELLKEGHPDRFGYSVMDHWPSQTIASYTCGRFFCVDHVQDLYQKDLISIDIDVAPNACLKALSELDDETDFACFETGRNEPASIMQASIMYWSRTPLAREYRKGLRAFTVPHLFDNTGASWMIDQAALISVRRYLEDKHAGFNFVDLREKIGCNITDAMHSIVDQKVKDVFFKQRISKEPSQFTL